MRLGHALRGSLLACAFFATGAIVLAAPATAQIGGPRYAAIVVDNRSGNVLVAANADETRHPASLTKMMTLYMVFEALREGRFALDSRITFSEEAASRPPSKLGIQAGQSITVEQAILALVTRSANDVAAAVGERLSGGSEARFGQMMTMRARALGMTRTTFRNASGLPDSEQVTTARDMATLGRRLIADFPERYHYFGVSHAQFGGLRIRNHNRMLESYEGVDGIKTGFINASGFNIVTSASRGGRRVVGAVFGGTSWHERDRHMASLLDRGFDQLGVAGAATAQAPGLLRTAQAASLPGRAAAQPVGTTQAAPRTTAPRAQPAPQPARPTSQGAARAAPPTASQAAAHSQPQPRGPAASQPRTTTSRPPGSTTQPATTRQASPAR
ncbi:MAG: serine hydrolase, partial [Roseomonas sp.]|nr:serine hydrolase [Roseomonas sp.]